MYEIFILNISLEHELAYDENLNWFKDSLYLLLLLPLGILSIIFNLISMLIVSKKSIQRSSVFNYLKIYTLNSIFLGFMVIFLYFVCPTYFKSSANTYKLVKCLILPSYASIFYCFANVLDILININRVLTYSQSFPTFRFTRANKTSLTAFIFVIILNLPYFFIYDLKESSNMKCIQRKFFLDLIGKLIFSISLLIQGPLLLILVVASNGLSILTFRKFYKTRIQNMHTSDSQTSFSDTQKKRIRKNAKYEKNLLFMTVYMTAFAFLIHLIQFGSQVINYISYSLSVYFDFIQLFVVLFKQNFNFVFFYSFNNKFRKYFNSYFQF